SHFLLCVSFFFQAEDGIRDGHVTGVQTCALPISSTSVGCSKHGYCDEFSAPVGSISSTNSPAGAVQPTTAPAVGTCGFSDANRLLVAVGTEVPEIMNWCAGKLGP